MSAAFGEYSIVAYIHPLRGERLNLGLLVWHPRHGVASKFLSNISRISVVDETASADRVKDEIEEIKAWLDGWGPRPESPLKALSHEFTTGLVVTEPVPSRVSDPNFVLDRLTAALLPPAPFMRASSINQFTKSFAHRMEQVLAARNIHGVRTEFEVKETFQPVKVAVEYGSGEHLNVWRTASFASVDAPDQQLTVAKAMYAENLDLRHLPKYAHSSLNLAVQMPKPTARRDWSKALDWLHRNANNVEPFEDRASIEAKVPELAVA